MKEIDFSTIILGDVDRKDYPDFADAFVEYAEYDDGTELTDEELEELTGLAQELALERF